MEKRLSGFTLIEVIVAVAIISIITSASIGVMAGYYRTAKVDATARDVVSFLRTARQAAISNETGSDYSVYIEDDDYIGFPGSTYDSENPENDVNSVPSDLDITTSYVNGLITFENYTGRLSNAGSVSVSLGGIEKVITISATGNITY